MSDECSKLTNAMADFASSRIAFRRSNEDLCPSNRTKHDLLKFHRKTMDSERFRTFAKFRVARR
jgi:hypothetical protein